MGFHSPAPIVEVNYPEVDVHADLPDATEHDGEIYLVKTGTGVFGLGRKRAGMWLSNGIEWTRLGVLTGSGSVLFSSPPDGKKQVKNIYFDPDVGTGEYVFEREE